MLRLGSWIENMEHLKRSFNYAKPYPHVVIDNFFTEEYANTLLNSFPEVTDKWIRYWNPIEKKFALNKFSDNPTYNDLFNYMQTDEFISYIKGASGISNLEADPHLHGAGVHFHPPGGKLDMHLDYSVHPLLHKERRVNLIIYLNKEWNKSYNGDLQLWDRDFTECTTKIYPVFNRAVLFQTNDISYHGMPQMINCEEGNGRKSIAIYYISDSTNVGQVRYKAHFRPLPDQPVNDKLKKLYELRNTTTLTQDILQNIYPRWDSDGNGYW